MNDVAKKYKWKVKVFGDNSIVVCFYDKPCLWYRFWFWLFFGWKWEPLDAS